MAKFIFELNGDGIAVNLHGVDNNSSSELTGTVFVNGKGGRVDIKVDFEDETERSRLLSEWERFLPLLAKFR